MPQHVVELVIDALKDLGKKVDESRIAILGFTYKGDVDDMRNTPAKPIINKLKTLGAHMMGFDPMIGIKQVKKFKISQSANLDECLKNTDCAVVITDHSNFKKIRPEKMKKLMNTKAALVDARGVFDPKKLVKAGFAYRGVGRSAEVFMSSG